ncbi:MAG: hypothetical protein HC842_06550 [Cytophagales bacterium]|nr:hypothetical protein [Cytophagales bacterium]
MKHFYLRADSIGHIYLAGSNDVLAANVISAIGTRMDGITLIGNEDWLQFPSLSLDQMERLGICLVGSQFIHYQSAEALDFREKYLKTHGELPSKYAYLGYETLWFAGQQLRQSGTLFQAELMQKPFVNGKLSEGFCFYHSTTNTYVPLTKLEAGAPVLINPQP